VKVPHPKCPKDIPIMFFLPKFSSKPVLSIGKTVFSGGYIYISTQATPRDQVPVTSPRQNGLSKILPLYLQNSKGLCQGPID